MIAGPEIQIQLRNRSAIRNLLHFSGLNVRSLGKKSILLIRRRESRLQWPRALSRRTREQWRNVLFTDEMRACLRHIDGKRRVWRRSREQHAECCV